MKISRMFGALAALALASCMLPAAFAESAPVPSVIGVQAATDHASLATLPVVTVSSGSLESVAVAERLRSMALRVDLNYEQTNQTVAGDAVSVDFEDRRRAIRSYPV